MPDQDVNRRSVLRTAATSAIAATAASYPRVLGANDRVQLGVIGCGSRGQYDMGIFQKNPAVQVAALCDVWGDRVDEAAQKAPGARKYGDYRKLLEEGKDLDAVLIATPDHWHSRISIAAVQAGKDVYCEKPLTLTMDEGSKVVKAARENNRVFQTGMQQRSGPHYMQARDQYIQAGKLGKITLARTWWHGNAWHLRKAPAALAQKPANLDWDMFLGPVKWRDWDPQQYWNFRAYLDFGGGQVTDLFTHWIDAVHMFMLQDDPISAVAAGGIYAYPDGRTAPDTIDILLEYPAKWTATFEATLAPGIKGAAIQMCGTEGNLYIDRSKFIFTPADRGAQPVEVKAVRELTIDHVENFLACMRSRQRPNGDVYIGHRSAQASHLGNLAYEQRRRIQFDPQREEILPL
jgi:predicted dehydrogenase